MPVREARRHKALEDRAEVARLTREGQSERAIARVLGVSPRMIHKHRVMLRREWEYSANRNFAEHVAERLANYEAALAAAWVKLRETGSVKWLQAILDCNQHIVELLGLDEYDPERIPPRQPTGREEDRVPAGMTPEEYQQMREQFAIDWLISLGYPIDYRIRPGPTPASKIISLANAANGDGSIK